MKRRSFVFILFIALCLGLILGNTAVSQTYASPDVNMDAVSNTSQGGIRYYADQTGYIEKLPNDEIGNVANDGSPHEMYAEAASETTVTDDGREITENFEPATGYINANGEMVPFGYTNSDGKWIPLGYVNADGDWVALGYKNADGKWILYEDGNEQNK